MSLKKTFFIFIFLLVANIGKAQLFSNEIGAFAGPVAMYSDYGERNDSGTNFGNVGFGIGLLHYMNFSTSGGYSGVNIPFFEDHFKIRNEILYTKVNLQHYGEYVDPSRTTLTAQQLRGMRGESSVFSVGTNLEYHLLSIRAFESGGPKFAPSIGLGINYSLYTPKASSTLGVLGDPAITPVKYQDAFSNDAGSTFALIGTMGTRYKISPFEDLSLSLRWQFFFSNWVDGLNPDENLYPENKANDWMFSINLAYIFYLE
ncbi:THC0290_0291 family protein [Ascidiimonas sp. W6]|uniref:THC0290_0291 family protein n=1 Tax=Ascidiimonas meishanensis TaxID=3128903 RepID=UPI0030EBDB05